MNSYPASDATLAAARRRSQGNRMMTVLVVLISGMLLGLGVMGWWFLAGINTRYSQVVTETAKSLNQLHEIGLHSFTGYGNIVELRQTRDPKAREALVKTVMEQRAINDRVFANLKQSLTEPELKEMLEQVIVKRQIFRTETDLMLAALGDTGVPTAEASLKLLQHFVAYQQACDAMSDRIESNSVRACQQMADEVKNLRVVFLVIGALPVVAALIFMLLTLVLLQWVNINAEIE